MYGNVNMIATSRLANLIRTKHMLPIHQNANEYGDFLHETYANLLVAHLACALIGFPTDMQKQTRNQFFFFFTFTCKQLLLGFEIVSSTCGPTRCYVLDKCSAPFAFACKVDLMFYDFLLHLHTHTHPHT